MNNPTLPPTKLVLRTFTTDLPAEAVKLKLQRIVEQSPLFNTSFLNGEWAEDTRIGGFDQQGDKATSSSVIARNGPNTS